MKTKAAGWSQRGEVWWVGGGDWKKCGDGDPRSAEAYPSYGHPRGQNRTGAEGGVLGPLTSKVTQRTPAHAQLEGGWFPSNLKELCSNWMKLIQVSGRQQLRWAPSCLGYVRLGGRASFVDDFDSERQGRWIWLMVLQASPSPPLGVRRLSYLYPQRCPPRLPLIPALLGFLCGCCSIAKLYLFCDPMDCSPPGPSCPWDFPRKNIVVGSHFLLQGILWTQGLNQRLLHWQVDSIPQSHRGSPSFL